MRCEYFHGKVRDPFTLQIEPLKDTFDVDSFLLENSGNLPAHTGIPGSSQGALRNLWDPYFTASPG